MIKDNGSPRWAVLLLVLSGVLVDIVTLAWIWESVNLADPAPGDALIVTGAAILSAVLVTAGVALGIERTHGR